jgi:hypothetical protein
MRFAVMSIAILSTAALAPGTRAADATGYVSDPAASHLDFTGVQAGAEFKGTFHPTRWPVRISTCRST